MSVYRDNRFVPVTDNAGGAPIKFSVSHEGATVVRDRLYVDFAGLFYAKLV
jgi:hypothetical protein